MSMDGKFKLKGINYDVELTDNHSEVRSVNNYRIERTSENSIKLVIFSNVSGKDFLFITNKISRYLLTAGIITAKELQNLEDELMDIWMFKNFGYTE